MNVMGNSTTSCATANPGSVSGESRISTKKSVTADPAHSKCSAMTFGLWKSWTYTLLAASIARAKKVVWGDP